MARDLGPCEEYFGDHAFKPPQLLEDLESRARWAVSQSGWLTSTLIYRGLTHLFSKGPLLVRGGARLNVVPWH